MLQMRSISMLGLEFKQPQIEKLEPFVRYLHLAPALKQASHSCCISMFYLLIKQRTVSKASEEQLC